MLTWNLKRIFDLRMIKNPYSFMKSNGFSQGKSRRYADGIVNMLSLADLEKFCLLLNVTPDDIIEWKADPKKFVPENHPLRKYIREENAASIIKEFQNLPIEKVRDALDALKNIEK